MADFEKLEFDDESRDYDYNLFDLLDESEPQFKQKEYDYNIFDLLEKVDLSMQDLSRNLLNEKIEEDE